MNMEEEQKTDCWFSGCGFGRGNVPNILAVFSTKKKFKGNFQEACQYNHNNWFARINWKEKYGWIHEQHCPCMPCEKKCKDQGLKYCTNRDCDGCKRKAEGRMLPLAIKKARLS